MLDFLKGAIIIIAEIVIGAVWAFIYIAGVVLVFLLALGALSWLVQNF